LKALEEKVGLDRITIANLFDALERAELLVKVMAYGSSMEAVRKPIKYLFMSPNIRMSFFQFTGLEDTYLTRLGKLLEDSVGSHLYREIVIGGYGSFRYDSMQGGADFIVQIGNSKQIVLEVGIGKKGIAQVKNTMKEKKADYGIVYSSNGLKLSEEENIVNIPLDYYFLM
jgi:predicted AAA+ superfamily ATPase